MNLEHLLALVEVGKVYVYLSVETTCTQQGRVEHVGAVGSCEDDDTTVRSETVHLRQ